MSKSNLITIASFSFPYEAQIAKARLLAEEIPAFIADEHTINMQWLYSNALGGVKLQVPTQFAEKANEILAQDLSAEMEETFGKNETQCSKCGSSDITPYTKGKKPAFLVLLFMGFPLFFYKHGFKCRACGEFTKT